MIHDWSQVDCGLFHDFHQAWIFHIANALNDGLMPQGFSALVERDAVRNSLAKENSIPEKYAKLANHISIKRSLRHVVSVIDILSPGQKQSTKALFDYVNLAVDFLNKGVNLLIVDLFPASRINPQRTHKAVWDVISGQPCELPSDKPMTLASYVAGAVKTAYVRPVGYSDVLPDMPAWLDEESYVPVPLESTYRATWESCPEDMREVVEFGLPSAEDQTE